MTPNKMQHGCRKALYFSLKINYTSTRGEACGFANVCMKEQEGFTATMGHVAENWRASLAAPSTQVEGMEGRRHWSGTLHYIFRGKWTPRTRFTGR